MNKLTDDRYETRRRDNGEQARHERKVLMWLGALIVIGFSVGQALATPWTDENGNPNPECYSEKCHETGIPDAPHEPREPRDPATPTKEVHNGFVCRVDGVVRYHAAARLVMTQEHLDAAKAEADAKVKSGALIKDCPADLKARIIAADDWVQE
jgi:hypothetical protein